MARTDPRPNYGSKRRCRPDGYVDIYDPAHPLARADGYVFEHRKVAWDSGLLTDPSLEVHHRNRDRSDNRPENLEPKDSADHARDHAEEAGAVRNQHGEFAVKPRGQRASDMYPSAGAMKPDRECQRCSAVIPAAKRRDARYCSPGCRVAAWHGR